MYVATIKDIDEPCAWRFTKAPNKAKRFADIAEALEFYRTQSARRPLRDDGRPNRPLAAFIATFTRL